MTKKIDPTFWYGYALVLLSAFFACFLLDAFARLFR